MATRDEILRVLVDIARRIEAEGIGEDFDVEAFEYLFEHGLRQKLFTIENKIDRLLGMTEEFGPCRLAGAGRGGVIELITKLGSPARSDALKYLGTRLEGAHHLTICDPYFLKPGRVSINDYVSEIESVLPAALGRLVVFSGKQKRDPAVAKGLNELFKQKQIRVRSYKTDEIHDRVWIRDHQDAFCVGTSFGGVGRKLAFILPLPQDDLRTFNAELYNRQQDLSFSKSV